MSIGTIIGPGLISAPPGAGCKIVAAPGGSDSMTYSNPPTMTMPIKTARKITPTLAIMPIHTSQMTLTLAGRWLESSSLLANRV